LESSISRKSGYFLLLKFEIYLSLVLYKGCASYRRSLQLSKENIQYFKKCNLITVLFFWVIFVLLDPDPGIPSNPDQITSTAKLKVQLCG
jgi:hypothetical protein